MRILGRYGFLLVTLALTGCGPANSIEEGVPEDAEYKAPPKIEFAKRKTATHSAPKSAPATTTEVKK